MSAFKSVDDCRSWTMFVNLAEQSTRDEPGAPTTTSTVNISFEEIDGCTGQRTDLSLQLDNAGQFQASSASINIDTTASLSTCGPDLEGNFQCTESSAPVTATFSWTASGAPARSTTVRMVHTADRLLRSRSAGNAREATATGVLSVAGQSYSLAAADETLASIVENSQSSLTIVQR